MEIPRLREQILSISSFLLFLGLMLLVWEQTPLVMGWDATILSSVSRLNWFSLTFFKWVTQLSSPIFTSLCGLGIAGWFGYRHQSSLATLLALTVIGGDALAWGVKQLIHRPRPLMAVIPENGFSFPSGHVFSAVLLALILGRLIKHQVLPRLVKDSLVGMLMIGVVLIMVARIGLRAHFPTDTLGSVLLAFAWWYQVHYWLASTVIVSR